MNAFETYSEAVEQKFAALDWSRHAERLDRESGVPDRQLVDGGSVFQNRDFRPAERWALRVADSYFWSTDIARAVVESGALPEVSFI